MNFLRNFYVGLGYYSDSTTGRLEFEVDASVRTCKPRKFWFYDYSPLSPDRRNFLSTFPPALSEKLITQEKDKIIKNSILWAGVNASLLVALLYDISLKCPSESFYVECIEYAFATILFLNTVYHMIRCFYVHFSSLYNKKQPQTVNNISSPRSPEISYNISRLPSSSFSTSLNKSLDPSFGNSRNSSMYNNSINASSYSWSSNLTQNGSPNMSPIMQLPTTDELINDEESLNRYLKDYETFEKSTRIENQHEQSSNVLSSFWSHPLTQNSKNAPSALKKCKYQLASSSPASSSSSPGSKSDEKASPLNSTQNADIWRYLNVKPGNLTQWNANLRLWISQTILERLVTEFKQVDESLEKHGLVDVKIGSVGLDRLRKTAQMAPIQQSVPTLSALIPFLELTTNQEYLVKRIKELARGGSISDFKWNGGSSHNDKEWDYSLPTDSAIIMHLFASYMDTQLMPQPNKPDAKPFSNIHFFRATEKNIPHDANTIAIHNVSEKPPYYQVIIGEEIYELGKGYNNLFNCILFFLVQVNKREHGMLGRVNLGRAGVNMLWIIGS